MKRWFRFYKLRYLSAVEIVGKRSGSVESVYATVRKHEDLLEEKSALDGLSVSIPEEARLLIHPRIHDLLLPGNAMQASCEYERSFPSGRVSQQFARRASRVGTRASH